MDKDKDYSKKIKKAKTGKVGMVAMKQSKFLKALVENNGSITKACESADIHRMLYYKWLKEDEEFKEKVNSLNELNLDLAEKKLMELIEQNDRAAIIFYLKSKGKSRGYGERALFDMNVNGDIKLIIPGVNDNDDNEDDDNDEV